ncbi:MAG: Holliday junction branch migration protein RuvA [Lachnospiraceae bacterium]|nr:Holliday junction branch migration protein RuvA [Lachnospiraceae bacterium]
MFAYIKGTIEDIDIDYIVVESNNVGFKIMTSSNVISKLSLHEERTIYTYMNVREDDISLFGFLTKDEIEAFKLLIGVSGIGPRNALSIMSALTMDELRMAIIAGDYKAIAKANGVGPKTAQKAVIELKDKFKLEDVFGTPESTDDSLSEKVGDDIIGDAVLALNALGYSESEAYKIVKKTALNGSYDTVEALIKASLKNIM